MMSSKKILVVDDEKDCCESFESYLKRHHHYVHVAYDGREAMHLLKDNTYDYIFFDCNMPELSGVELVKVINEKSPGAKKIMISGYDLLNRNFIKSIGVDLFLSKPIKLETIRDIIEDSAVSI